MRIILIFTGFFLFTLIGFQPYIRMLGIIPLLVYVLFMADKVRIDQRFVKLIVFLITILIIYSFYYYRFGPPYSTVESWNAFPNNIVALAIMIFLAITIIFVVSDPDAQDMMPVVFKMLLVVHITPFIIQFLSIYVTGYYPDLHQMLTGVESRYLEYAGSGLIGSFGLYRCTGWSTEPSNYSAIIAILVTVYLYLRNLKVDIISVIALATMVLTFSSAAYIEFLLIVVALVIQSVHRSAGITLSGIVMLVAIFFMAGGDKYLEMVTGRFQMTSGSRVNLAMIPFEREGELKVFGPGPFGIEKEYWYDTQGETAERSLASVNDSGFVIFLLLCFGMMGFLVYFMLFKWLVYDLSTFLMMSAVFLSKLSFYHPAFYFFIVLFFFATRRFRDFKKQAKMDIYEDDPDFPPEKEMKLHTVKPI